MGIGVPALVIAIPGAILAVRELKRRKKRRAVIY
jgi:hypothetical protein